MSSRPSPVRPHPSPLGLKSWESLAAEAGIPEAHEISQCAAGQGPTKRIEAGLALAQELQIAGTPTVIVNGWRFVAPTKENLQRAINAVRRGRPANEIGREE